MSFAPFVSYLKNRNSAGTSARTRDKYITMHTPACHCHRLSLRNHPLQQGRKIEQLEWGGSSKDQCTGCVLSKEEFWLTQGGLLGEVDRDNQHCP